MVILKDVGVLTTADIKGLTMSLTHSVNTPTKHVHTHTQNILSRISHVNTEYPLMHLTRQHKIRGCCHSCIANCEA